MPSPDEVSVIIPAYNRSGIIGRAIKSILGGTVIPGEIIVSDDGSTDDTVRVAKSFGNPVRVIRRKNAGPAAARNAGVEASTREWITFLDSDDYYLPHKIEQQCEALDKYPKQDVLVSNGYIIEGPDPQNDRRDNFTYGNLKVNGTCVLQAAELTPYLCKDLAGYVEGLLIRRSVWEKLGGMDERIWGIEDLDFYMRLSLSHSLIVLGEPGYVKDYDEQPEQRITSEHGCDPGFFAYYIRICQKALSQFPDMPESARNAIVNRAHDWARPLIDYHLRTGNRHAAASVRRRVLNMKNEKKLKLMGLFTMPLIGIPLHNILRKSGAHLPPKNPRVSDDIWSATSV